MYDGFCDSCMGRESSASVQYLCSSVTAANIVLPGIREYIYRQTRVKAFPSQKTHTHTNIHTLSEN